jgi:hypothetical protein
LIADGTRTSANRRWRTAEESLARIAEGDRMMHGLLVRTVVAMRAGIRS